MNIVISIDHNFVMPCGVLIHSICCNNKDIDICFFIITDNTFTEDDKVILKNTAVEFNSRNELICNYIDKKEVRKKVPFSEGVYGLQVFYRLFLADLLPRNIEKVLFLDGDIVVRGSLKELWNIDVSSVALGACQDALEGNIEQYNRLEYSSRLGYFNAGVMLINLEYWRKNNFQEKFLSFIREKPDKVRLNDQDILNYYCRNAKVDIPLKYNVQSLYLTKERFLGFDIWLHHEEYLEARQSPVVIHYSGDRPWEKGCNHPFKDEFFKYRDETIWKNEMLWPIRKTYKQRMIDILRPVGAKIGVCHLLPDVYDRKLVLTDSYNNCK